ncbi:dehydrogenase [Carnobacterium sp. PL17GRE32]|uniref:dehydrogenase n=1 Tax=unclassified Carnobacterium TaxID=257487 RepID=UPI0011EDFEE2|nr:MULTISPECIES: dehydrogenase [unclassified Carnobacterium]KAF3300939.1 dehydrogenase [Carnobacterium sp. PL12RED10]KAF3305358.1 dehydrogenase [Carnobacterium sp. PL17GRE32]
MVEHNLEETQEQAEMGKTLQAIKVGDTFRVTESIRERDVLLYMGVTSDSNPAYLQQTSHKAGLTPGEVVVPPIALMGIITRTVSMNFPGPGSRLVEMNINIIHSIPHNSIITFEFEVIRVEELKQFVTIHCIGKFTNATDDDRVLDAMLTVLPPQEHLQNDTETIDAGVFQRISGGDSIEY